MAATQNTLARPGLSDYRKNSRAKAVLRMFFRSWLSVVSLIVFVLILLVAIFADVIVDEGFML